MLKFYYHMVVNFGIYRRPYHENHDYMIMGRREEFTEETTAEVAELKGNIHEIHEMISQTSNKTVKKALKVSIKMIEEKLIQLGNHLKCTCDIEGGEEDPNCRACLNQWRNERYGYGVHDVECVCNDCTHGQDGYPRADY